MHMRKIPSGQNLVLVYFLSNLLGILLDILDQNLNFARLFGSPHIVLKMAICLLRALQGKLLTQDKLNKFGVLSV